MLDAFLGDMAEMSVEARIGSKRIRSELQAYAAGAMNVIAEPPRAYEVVYEKAEKALSLLPRAQKFSNLISFLRTQLASHVPPKAGWPSDKKGLLQRFRYQNSLSRLS